MSGCLPDPLRHPRTCHEVCRGWCRQQNGCHFNIPPTDIVIGVEPQVEVVADINRCCNSGIPVQSSSMSDSRIMFSPWVALHRQRDAELPRSLHPLTLRRHYLLAAKDQHEPDLLNAFAPAVHPHKIPLIRPSFLTFSPTSRPALTCARSHYFRLVKLFLGASVTTDVPTRKLFYPDVTEMSRSNHPPKVIPELVPISSRPRIYMKYLYPGATRQ